MPIISCHNIKKNYSTSFSGRIKKKALDDLSFTVTRNEVFGIVGPNGAGKSTVLKILLGFVRQDSGEALINGQLASHYAGHRILGYLPENPSLYGQLSLVDHLHFAAKTAGVKTHKANKRIEEIAETVGLSHVIKAPIKSFSKGMTQRAALAYALFLKPEILILDEPMSGLDPFGRQLVVKIINEYQQKGATILLCSHILTDVERICSKITIMDKGKLAASTTPKELSFYDGNHDGMTRLESFFLDTISSGGL